MKKYKFISYTLHDISNGEKKAFEATVHAPNGENGIVFGDSQKEIEEGIECFIEGLSLANMGELKKSATISHSKKSNTQNTRYQILNTK